ncbi:hypothetical protein OMAG_001440 [Candidatus Omnitrophus magneticus]|uniref:Uncharacterized protein n=1 Tax=Candidatus Omnitrophus magneticus TaxID=1609969 RepID=A0A0F0CT40_9BACT|nr:hypothetical protein OMAG_001440 [Candidatus Omnitrophus magneticus]
MTNGQAAIPFGGTDKHYRVSNKLDFSLNNAANADVIQALSIKTNTKVRGVYVRIVTPEGGSATATVGDDSTTNGWDTSVNLNAAAGTITQTVSTDSYGADGKIYTAADTIDLSLGAALDGAVVYVYAECLDLN